MGASDEDLVHLQTPPLDHKENDLPCGDGAYTIVVNSAADTEGLSPQLRNLFDYLNDMTVAEDDPGIAALDDAVQMCNNGEARLEIMLWEHELQNKWARGREEGFVEGLAEGKAELLEATREVARKLLAKGMSKEEVAEITGLSLEELTNL